jgi:ABC-2 type transport system permease protein
VTPGTRQRTRSLTRQRTRSLTRQRTRSLTWTVAGMDLRQLWQSPDFLLPMLALAVLFFVFIPATLLWAITHVHSASLVAKISNTLDLLPKSVNAQIVARSPHATPAARSSYALAVYLFAPLAVIVPMTISTAVGANCLVGEREKGTGEFLAHSPASERQIYAGKLIASLLPGYLTTVVGFGIYSVVVDLIVGPQVGGWFFPTGNWWVLMFWVVPPFLAITLSVVLRLSARVKSAAAAQQASGLVTIPLILISYAVASGGLFGAGGSAFWVGLLAWLAAAYGLARGARSVKRTRLLGVEGDLA